jgi:hypothetical protein
MITRVRALFSMNVFPDLSAVATLNPVTMESLQFFRGDTIIVRFVVDLSLLSFEPHGSPQWEEAARHCTDLPKL